MALTGAIPILKNVKKSPQEECEARGWVWNEALKSCDNPNVEPLPEKLQPAPAPEPDPTTVKIPMAGDPRLTEEEIRLREIREKRIPQGAGGSILTDAERAVVGQISDTEQFDAAVRAGVMPSAAQGIAQQQARADAQRKLTLAAQTGNIDMATAMQMEEMGINWKEALLSGTSNIVPAAIGGAATLGSIGAAATLPAGGAGGIPAAIIGGAGGAIAGFYVGVNSNIKAQKGDLIGTKTTELKKRTTAMNNYISAANSNPANAEEYQLAYIMEKSLIRKDYNSLVKEANEDLSLWGGNDGTPQIVAYEIYFESTEPSLNIKMEQAILKPDPTRAYISAESVE